MFLDKFEAKVTAIDGEPVKPEESYDLTFWSSGKVERSLQGKPEAITKSDVADFVALMGMHYGITPEEYRDAVQMARQVRAHLDRSPRKPE